MSAEALLTTSGLRPVADRRTGATGFAVRQIRVAVVGENMLSRHGVLQCLEDCPDIGVVGGVETADVVLLVVDGVTDRTTAFARQLTGRPGLQVGVVAADLDTRTASELVRAGVVTIIRRCDLTRLDLRRTIRSVTVGQAVLPADLLAGCSTRADAPSTTVSALSEREVDVLRLLADGSDTREIAHRLCYSERTVKAVIQDITTRFSLRNRSHAVAFALRRALI